MSKSFEDLEQLTVDQLKGIATDLGLDPKANIKKAELVQLVYDAQQPEPEAEDQDETPADPDKPITTNEEFEARVQAVVDHFGGTDAVEDGENEDGAIIFKIVDELTDEEKARGTLLELEDQVVGAPIGEDAPPLDEDVKPEAPAEPDLEEVVLETPDLADEDNFAKIKEGLKPLGNFGLQYTVDGSVIQFRVGSKRVTTTLNQPAHRVVRTAEQLCNFR